MKIEVKPIVKKSWHGKIGKESFTRPKKIQALANDDMTYATGLSPEDEEKYSKLLNKDLSNRFDPEQTHPFWDSALATIKLENATMIFDTSKPLDYIHICILKASKFVANSQKSYENGEFPEATHVIFDETQDVEIKAQKVQLKKRAILEANELTLSRKIEIILILSDKNCKGKSEDFVEVELDKILQTKSKEFLQLVDTDSKENSTHALILECLQSSILRKDGHRILYHDSVLGSDIEDVIAYLNKDDNQSLRLRLMEAVNK